MLRYPESIRGYYIEVFFLAVVLAAGGFDSSFINAGRLVQHTESNLYPSYTKIYKDLRLLPCIWCYDYKPPPPS